MIPILINNAGKLITDLGIGITGSYSLLTLLLIIGIMIFMMMLGVPLEVLLILTAFLILSLSIWHTTIITIILGVTAIIIGVLIVILFWRLLTSGRGY
jgi:hypothetical protein